MWGQLVRLVNLGLLLVLLGGCRLKVPNPKSPSPEELAANAPVLIAAIVIVLVVDAFVIWAAVRRQAR